MSTGIKILIDNKVVRVMDILRKIYDAGVVGAGGAGFPTHKKLDCKVEYFIINGAECEPLLKTDQYIMQNKSKEITAAAHMIGKLLQASHVVFALKRKYVNEAEAIKEAAEMLGADIEISCLESIYPAGDEQVIVHEVAGRTVRPGGIPLSVGAVVSNVSTMFNVFEAINDKPVTYKYLTVAGEVKNPTIIKAPIGTSVAECIKAAGGPSIPDFDVIMGGPMMGKILEGEKADQRFITKTDGGIILIPQNHYLANRSRVTVEHMINQAKSACIQCSYCTDLCPRYLLGHKLRPNRVMRAMALEADNEEVLKDALICSECGVCELYACPMGLSPRKVNIYVKAMLRNRGINHDDNELYPSNSIMRPYRQIPVSRLLSRIDAVKLEKHVAMEPVELNPDSVSIALRQHIGAKASPVVNRGELVDAGRLIASVDYGAVGANIHASVKGVIEEVNESFIKIKSDSSGVNKHV